MQEKLETPFRRAAKAADDAMLYGQKMNTLEVETRLDVGTRGYEKTTIEIK